MVNQRTCQTSHQELLVAATDISPAPSQVDTPRPPRRRITSRLSSGHVLVIVAALLAAVANYAVLRGGETEVVVMVAAADIPAGSVITADHLRPAVVGSELGALDQLVTRDDVGHLDGRVAAVAIPAGAPLRQSDLVPASSPGAGERRISIPIERDRAVGGAIVPEDRIDVIRVVEGEASYLVSGARVLAVADASDAGLGSMSGFHVTIAVDADTALCLASAIESGGLTVVLSTGQEPVPVTPCDRGARVAVP